MTLVVSGCSSKNVVICKSQFFFVFKLDAGTLEAGLEKSGSNSLTILTTYYIHIDILNIICFLFLLRCFNKKWLSAMDSGYKFCYERCW